MSVEVTQADRDAMAAYVDKEDLEECPLQLGDMAHAHAVGRCKGEVIGRLAGRKEAAEMLRSTDAAHVADQTIGRGAIDIVYALADLIDPPDTQIDGGGS